MPRLGAKATGILVSVALLAGAVLSGVALGIWQGDGSLARSY